ncbi:hypothetical protein WR25_27010 isoform A [Diploscapter pachys]|uniref:ubiquitinyl hydrolase 1 n=2 Tax=Diploscapter pachys TaxID=2018661 RepID=A0A2A2L7H1_9BILA|nr:hypothetical protein WR25_27010 isoform A [Diploscapter pachys]
MTNNLTKQQQDAVNTLCRDTKMSSAEAVQILMQCDWDPKMALKKHQIEKIENGEKHHERNPSTSGELTSRKIPNHGYTFCLPDFDKIAPPDFRAFLEKELIEMSTQRRLEASKHLNWWTPFGQKLYALSTAGDGNCLLHAASLGMWGLHDRQLTLREALHEILVRGSRKGALWRRWKWAEHKCIQASELSLHLSDEEWNQEWQALVGLSSPVPRKCEDTASNATDQIYESLEAFHVFVLAHVLKRPIVVISDTVLRNAKGEELSPVAFGGIYLPLECPIEHCHRSPLCLCYDSAHFSPLVPMKNDLARQQLIPIMTVDRTLLPVHFAVDPGADFTWWRDEEDEKIAQKLELSDADKLTLISQYMDLVRLDVRRGSIKRTRDVRTPANDKSKSLTIACSGIVNGKEQEKNRLQIEIRQIRDKLKRTLRIASDDKKDKKSIDARLCADEMSKDKCVVAAKLVCSSHEYMEDMWKEYIKKSRERFFGHSQEPKTNGQKRDEADNKRMSRSFSASSIPITCINDDCKQPALQSNNFLCAECFEQQKELMTSFNCGEQTTPLRQFPYAQSTTKSHTMPSISSHSATNGTVMCTPKPSSFLPDRVQALPFVVPSAAETPVDSVHTSANGSPAKMPRMDDFQWDGRGEEMNGCGTGSGSTTCNGSHTEGSPRKKPVLDVTLNGQSISTSVCAMEDEFGVTYYSMGDSSTEPTVIHRPTTNDTNGINGLHSST